MPIDPTSAISVITDSAGFAGGIIVVLFAALYFVIRTGLAERCKQDELHRAEREEWKCELRDGSTQCSDQHKETARILESAQKEQNDLLKQLLKINNER